MNPNGPTIRLAALFCLVLAGLAPARTIYVDTDANGLADGSTWHNAYNHLQDALAAASRDDQILVAAGTYNPDSDAANPEGTGDRAAMFELITDVTIKGGFAGLGHSNPDARDIALYPTILSGDLNSDDEPNFTNYHDNSLHVVNASGTRSSAILDGVTITAGHAAGTMNNDGAGLINYGGSPILINCTFTRNLAVWYGGAMYNDMFSKPTLINCIFTNNSAQYGGAVESRYYSDATFVNCEFVANTAEHGGAISNAGADATVINCLFSENHANHRGGAIHDRFECESILSNCILWGNTAAEGPQINLRFGCEMFIDYTDLQGGAAQVYLEESILDLGPGNMDADPCFAMPGHWDNNSLWVDGDYSLRPDSPCIDAADDTAIPGDEYDLDEDGDTSEPIPIDLAGNPRFNDGDSNGITTVDMGPFEFYWPPLEAQMRITPRSLNPTSRGNWVKAHFVMPPSISVEDVDVNTPLWAVPLQVESAYMDVFVNSDGLTAIEAGFHRTEFANALAPVVSSERQCEIEGMLISGQPFYGAASFRITGNLFNHLGTLSSHWLETDCTEPDFCGGFDFNQDGVVNFVDLALLDGHCVEFVGR